MNNTDKLLQYALLNYPVGTKFKCIFGSRAICTIRSGAFYMYNKEDYQERVCIDVVEKVSTGDGCVAIYSKQLGWAQIIKKGEPIYELY